MDVNEVMTALQAMGDEGIKRILLKHGVKEPFFGVKVEHLKIIQKKIKKDYQLAKDLFATGNADAMYLAGLIADDDRMTRAELHTWANEAVSTNISEYTVPWVAAGGLYGFELAMEWINSGREHVVAAGWSTLANIMALKPDQDLDIEVLRTLLKRVEQTIHSSDNRVRYTMNGFVISAGTYVTLLVNDAIATADRIGIVTVDKNGTACKVPVAADYIKKIKERGAMAVKKKTVKC